MVEKRRKKQREKNSCDNVCARRARAQRFTITETSFGIANWKYTTQRLSKKKLWRSLLCRTYGSEHQLELKRVIF